VFADLGLPNPELALAKAKLVLQLNECIQDQKLSHAKAAGLLGIERSRLEALLRGRTEKYTLDRLFRFLVALGQHVEISIRPNSPLPQSA
jgi:predicted XRE-type DNA-binding protein